MDAAFMSTTPTTRTTRTEKNTQRDVRRKLRTSGRHNTEDEREHALEQAVNMNER